MVFPKPPAFALPPTAVDALFTALWARAPAPIAVAKSWLNAPAPPPTAVPFDAAAEKLPTAVPCESLAASALSPIAVEIVELAVVEKKPQVKLLFVVSSSHTN